MKRILITILFAAIGGICGIKLKIPAGAMIGSMIAVGAYNILFSTAYMPNNLNSVGQILVGGFIGLKFSKETLLELKNLAAPVFILAISIIFFGIITGLAIHKITGMDLTTALFASSPGGLVDVSLIADAYGADVTKVVTMHTVRLLTVIIFMPTIIKHLTRFFSK